MPRIHKGSHRRANGVRYLTPEALDRWFAWDVRRNLWAAGWELYGNLILPYFGA